jgi:DNA-binding GntR family transcriptional regulator
VTTAMRSVRRAPTLATQVHEAILELITGGHIAPGERLVMERIAEQLGVSQTPVREAAARLVQEGLAVEAASGRLHVVALTESYVRDVFMVRSVLEGLCVELAAAQVTPADLEPLNQLLLETSATLPSGDHRAYARSDALLHSLMVERAGNRVLVRELQTLNPHIELIRGYSQRIDGAHLRASHQEHLQILGALQRGDVPRARFAMENHIRRALERIAGLVQFGGSAPAAVER